MTEARRQPKIERVQVDWQNFTPFPSLLGGLGIGVAVALLLLVTGRIAGVSGLLANAWKHEPDERWRWWFLLGMVISPWLVPALQPNLPQIRPSWVIGIAGLLAGFGTRLSGGCTSGHGVCGLSRMSPRSLVATLTFMVFGMLAVAVARTVLPGGAE